MSILLRPSVHVLLDGVQCVEYLSTRSKLGSSRQTFAHEESGIVRQRVQVSGASTGPRVQVQMYLVFLEDGSRGPVTVQW